MIDAPNSFNTQNTDIKIEKTESQFTFSGQAGEYFGIWFVNNVLTWVTLGIYSPWAKVRNTQYFYGNTSVADGHFQFTASPLKILRSRIIAVALLVLYVVSDNIQSTLAYIVVGSLITAYIVFAPILTVWVMSFRLRYSEWRGISFRFNKDYKGAYRVYLAPILLLGLIGTSVLLPIYSEKVEDFTGIPHYTTDKTSDKTNKELDKFHETDDINISDNILSPGDSAESMESESEIVDDEDGTYGDAAESDEEKKEAYVNPFLFIPMAILFIAFLLLLPYFDFINVRFLSRNVRLGTAPFIFKAHAGDYYKIYGFALAAMLLLISLWIIEISFSVFHNLGIRWILIMISILAFPACWAYFKAKRYNLMMNKVVIDHKHSFIASTKFLAVLWIIITNSIMISITMGLMGPWAKIRTARYFLESTLLQISGDVNDFMAHQNEQANAMGEEIADVFDIDVGI